MYDHVTSINSITATVDEVTVKNALFNLLTYLLNQLLLITYWYILRCNPVFPCPRGSSKTNLQVLVLDNITAACSKPVDDMKLFVIGLN